MSCNMKKNYDHMCLKRRAASRGFSKTECDRKYPLAEDVLSKWLYTVTAQFVFQRYNVIKIEEFAKK